MMRSGHVPILGMLLATAAFADVVPITLDYVYSGTAKDGAYLTATFEDIATNTVQLTLSTVGLGGQVVTEWDFNLDPSYTGTLAFSPSTGIDTGTDKFKADGDGWYDISFTDTFASGGTYVYTITGTGLTARDFAYYSTVNSGQSSKGPYLSAAHLQKGADGGGSEAWIGAVPEPSEYPLYGGVIAALFLGVWRRLRSRAR